MWYKLYGSNVFIVLNANVWYSLQLSIFFFEICN